MNKYLDEIIVFGLLAVMLLGGPVWRELNKPRFWDVPPALGSGNSDGVVNPLGINESISWERPSGSLLGWDNTSRSLIKETKE